MKVRCKACGKVSKVSRGAIQAPCPACGEQLLAGAEHFGAQSPSAQDENTGEGELPRQDRSASHVGCFIMGILLFGVPFVIAAMTEGDEAAYWVAAIAALIALIPLGVWFERQTIGRRQK